MQLAEAGEGAGGQGGQLVGVQVQGMQLAEAGEGTGGQGGQLIMLQM